MKKTIKYSILGLAALCTVVLCGGYYMLGHALKPEGLITRSRNIVNNLGVILDLRVVASDPSINIIDKINEQLIAN